MRSLLTALRFLGDWALASLLLLSGGCSMGYRDQSQSLISINIVDRNGMTETVSSRDRLRRYESVDFMETQPYEKVMRVYGRDSCGDIPAIITSYHPNGQVRQYLEVVNNRACGSYREWHSNGQLKVEMTLVGGVGDIGTAAEKSWMIDGESCAWDEEGHRVAAIPYIKGVLDGDSIYYHDNGNLWKRVPFKNGLLHGDYALFCADGTLLQTTPYVGGKCHGTAYRYWNGDTIAACERYCDDLLEEGTYYTPQGSCICTIANGNGTRALFGKDAVAELREYRNGVEEGQVEVLDARGRCIATYCIKDGEKNGEEIEYAPMRPGQKKAKPRLSVNWVDGRIQGKVRTWYSNGQLESQREISENQKNGIATAWYEDGSLMLLEEYEHDTLKSGKYFRIGEKIPVTEVRDGKGIATIYDSVGNFLRKVDYQNGMPLP